MPWGHGKKNDLDLPYHSLAHLIVCIYQLSGHRAAVVSEKATFFPNK